MSSISKNQIAFLCHPYHRGGVTRWMADAASEFANYGYEVFFVTVTPIRQFISGKNRPTMISLLKKENPKIKIISQGAGILFEFGTPEYRSGVYTETILKNVPPGIPIIVSDDFAVWDSAAALKMRNPFIGVLHSDDPYYYDLANKYSDSVTLFVSVSERIAKKCLKLPSLTGKSIPVIPCGIPLKKLTLGKQLENNLTSLIWVGRIEETQKRVSDIIKIALHLKSEKVSFHLDVIGHGSETDWLNDQISKNSLEEYVSVYGWMDSQEILKKMNASDFLLLTSNYEGMPVVVMEALSEGCGVISSKVSGVEDLENHPLAKKSIWIFPTGDVITAVNSIKSAKTISPIERKEAARKLAELEFTITKCIEKYISVISGIKFRVTETNPEIKQSLKQKYKSYILALLRFFKLKFYS